MRRPVSLLAVALAALVWAAALVAAPSNDWPRLSAVVYAAGSIVCHQRPERSFHRDGAQYPVCARCLGLYLGAVAGVLVWSAVGGVGPNPRPRARRLLSPDVIRPSLIVVALPTMATVAAVWVVGWDSGNVVRAVFALPLGGVIAALVAAVAAGDLR